MTLAIIPYCLVSLSLFLCWWPPSLNIRRLGIPLWSISLALALITGCLVGLISVLAFLLCIIFSLLVFFYKAKGVNRYLHLLCFTLIVVMAYLLASHYFNGFTYYSVFDQFWFGKSVFFTSLHIHFDSSFTGAVLFCFLAQPLRSLKGWKIALKRIVWAPLMLVFLFLIADYIWLAPDPKWNRQLIYYLLVSLLFVAMAEEAFFRLLLQKQIEKYFGSTDVESTYLAIVISTIIYTLWHLGGTLMLEMTIVFFLGGLINAYVFGRSRSIELAILSHFSINAIHLIFYVYPGVEY